MKQNFSNPMPRLTLATLALVGAVCMAGPVAAQVAGGTTTVDVSITESTQLAMGWSVKKTLMGKTIYNDAGQKVGKVEDLIISPDGKVSYFIVGAGGFIGMGRHDVAIAVTRVEEKKKAGVATADAKAKIDQEVTALQADVKSAEAKLAEMKQATAVRWREFEAGVNAATARLRKSLDTATG